MKTKETWLCDGTNLERSKTKFNEMIDDLYNMEQRIYLIQTCTNQTALTDRMFEHQNARTSPVFPKSGPKTVRPLEMMYTNLISPGRSLITLVLQHCNYTSPSSRAYVPRRSHKSQLYPSYLVSQILQSHFISNRYS